MTATYVYVSNAEDGEIRVYALSADGTLVPRERVQVEKTVMPMSVSPDRRWLIAATRAKPCSAYTFAIDRRSGSLQPVGKGPLAESFPYITLDRTGRWLLSASYGAHLVSVNPVGADGVVGEPQQVIPTARNAHAIRTDNSNRFVFVPHLGTDEVFQFRFDASTGRLSANGVLQLERGLGPRHLVSSPDNRFIYLLNELTATVTTLALDAGTGQLSVASSASALPPQSKLKPGAPRGPDAPPRDASNDIWASDVHVTPDGRFVYAAERTSSSISVLRADGGRLTYSSSTPTEAQPRGFNIDSAGRTLVACGEKSDTISSYAIDSATGALKLLGKYAGGKGANWVEIVSFD